MKWFLIFNPFACLTLLLLAICIFTIGYLLAIDVLIIEIGDANGSKHKIASDPENVYSGVCTFLFKRRDSDIGRFAKELIKDPVIFSLGLTACRRGSATTDQAAGSDKSRR
jgi:uncharacterized membrane protein